MQSKKMRTWGWPAGLVAVAAPVGFVQAAPVLEVGLTVNNSTSWAKLHTVAVDPASTDGATHTASAEVVSNDAILSVDIDFRENPFVRSAITITNSSDEDLEYTLTSRLKVTPGFPAVFFGGYTGATLTDTSLNGSATLTDIGGTPFYDGLIDNVSVLTIYNGPLLLNTQVGVPGDSEDLGVLEVGLVDNGGPLLDPTIPGPAVNQSLAIRHSFVLSAGDSVEFNSFLRVTAIPEPGTLLGLLTATGLLSLRSRRN